MIGHETTINLHLRYKLTKIEYFFFFGFLVRERPGRTELFRFYTFGVGPPLPPPPLSPLTNIGDDMISGPTGEHQVKVNGLMKTTNNNICILIIVIIKSSCLMFSNGRNGQSNKL